MLLLVHYYQRISKKSPFLFLGIFILVITVGITTIASLSPQVTQQYAASATAFGFTQALFITTPSKQSGVPPMNVSDFEKAVDDMVSHHIQWVRVGIPEWEAISSKSDTSGTVTINWNQSNMAQFVSAFTYAQNKGMKILLTTNVPLNGTTSYSFTDYQTLAKVYYTYLAQQFGSLVTVWQIYNEPNFSSFRNYSGISEKTSLSSSYLSQMNTIVGIAKQQIKAVNPQALILVNMSDSAGHASGDAVGLPKVLNPWISFIQGIKNNIDVIGLDIYSLSSSSVKNSLNASISKMEQQFGKPVIITETGQCSSSGNQASTIPPALSQMEKANPLAIIVYQYQDATVLSTNSCEQSFGIVDKYGNPKSSYNTLLQAMQGSFTPVTPPIQLSTPTPTPSSSSSSTPTPTPIPTSSPSDTFVSLKLGLQGIGSVGDNLNPQGSGTTPKHATRNVTIHVYSSSSSLAARVSGTATFNVSSGLFEGTFDLGTLPSGRYTFFVIAPRFLKKKIANVTLTAKQITSLTVIYLVNGDALSANTLGILDYNLIASCFGSKQNTSSCSNPQAADLNDDGVVDGIDYNLFLRELVSQPGQSGDQEPTDVTPSVTPTGNTTPTPGISHNPTPTPIAYTPGIPATPDMGADPWPDYVNNNSILNQSYYKKAADVMHSEKFPIWDGSRKTMQEIGYTYDTLDDDWALKRTSAGLQPNSNYFSDMLNPDPNIGLIAHVHSLGLKIGLYTSVGTYTCFNSKQGQIAGSYGYEAIDGAEFQKWGVDYMKLDWCGKNTPTTQSGAESLMQKWRKDLGPNITMGINSNGGGNPWSWATKDNTVNAFRVSGSIKNWPLGSAVTDQWNGGRGSVMGIIDSVNSHLKDSHSAPYHWSDAGYMHGGVNLTLDESKSEFSMWSMFASPLIVGADITKMQLGDITSQVIFNTEVIAIDQDPLVMQATRYLIVSGVEVWEKPLSGNAYAVAFLNTNSSAKSVSVKFSQINLPATVSNLRDLWQHKDLGPFTNSFTTTSIPAHGIQIVKGS